MTATVKFVITGYSEILLNKKHLQLTANAALRCERRLAILERSETAKRCESLLNALLAAFYLFALCSLRTMNDALSNNSS